MYQRETGPTKMNARHTRPPKGDPVRNSELRRPAEPTSTPTSTPARPQPYAYEPVVPANRLPNRSTASQPVRFEDDIDHESPAKKARIAEDDGAPEPKKRKSKKLRKSKKHSPASVDGPDEATHDEPTEVPTDHDESSNSNRPMQLDPSDPLETEEPPRDNPSGADGDTAKERKHKKKSKKKGELETNTEAGEAAPKWHRAVLEKKAKSIKVPEPQSIPEKPDVSMVDAPEASDAIEIDTGMPELHGLEPLPQPKPVITDTTKPTYETLPPWLARPIRVSPQSTLPFTELGVSPELGISPEIADRLSTGGFKQAFAIQTAVIPLLLPHRCKTRHSDVLVSAATGSGKTLAYVLPLVRDLSLGNRHLTRLRAVIVLPTRELVRQVHQVCEQCAGIFALNGLKKRVRVGMAMGSQTIDQEQAALVEREERYDPEGHVRRTKRLASGRGYDSAEDSDVGYNTEDEEKGAIRKREDRIPTLPDHVIIYHSKVDILICTPGRLVEHIKYTPGFSLDFVRWLVVDEADKLLSQNFQHWLDVVIPPLQADNMGSRNHKQCNLSGVRKVILSATMTRDLDRLEGLKLRQPKLVILEGSGAADEPEVNITRPELALPELLEEAAVKVSHANLKPLFLLDLLQSRELLGHTNINAHSQDPSDDETSSSGSDSELGSVSSSKSSFKPSVAGGAASILVFTKSNETALRLSRLLLLLSPALRSVVGTVTSTAQYSTRRRTIRSFVAGKLRVLVASDLVARGIDLPCLDHVINYDMPSSVASYVHRVGRTARAGKTGKAWTLYTNPEARWFWNNVASETLIQRSRKVERIRVTEEKEGSFDLKVSAYESALAKLGEEVSEPRHRTR
ncbi:P-loop containing nucleoside triphosphate hydrolase protein [Durotheca rogersii]|uniref:P-loop containing nucleoside triphosphate hydrolase protein n=1 Tax=Durotheca rogersii TaxID=419775 RepID=UPI0022212778|nr:P-loop containing nucleoside triphosphate hydrolase protein [Durotheca rogersii]KAI5864038.1 P-loop containing nucleoside triphosphate hydrolase protein [Durotheca rogersii]